MAKITPNPGSEAALEIGCICTVVDNQYGRGYHFVEGREPQFVITVGCPVHDPSKDQARSSEY